MAGKLNTKVYKCKKCGFSCRLYGTLVNHKCKGNLNIFKVISR